MEPEQTTFSQLLSDYPSIYKGLKKAGITTPSDLQQQLLSLPNQVDNAIIIAPENSGKKLALLLLSVCRFFNEEEGILAFVSHSKDLSQELFSLASLICKVPIMNLFMEKIQKNHKKFIIIGSPLQLTTLPKEVKDKIINVSLFEADFLFGFGYGESLNQFASSLAQSTTYQITCCQKAEEIEEFKAKWLKKAVKMNYAPVQEKASKSQKIDSQAVHFYQVGDKISLPISLYVTLKFGLVNPKVLILVEDLKQVYRYYLFLERAHIEGIGLYNHENPIDLKFYSLSLWMNGPTNVMISTKAIYDDIQNDVFSQNCKRTFKNKSFQLNNLATVICINLKYLQNIERIFDHFSLKPFLMTFIESNDDEVDCLQKLIKFQNSLFESVKAKEYPISKKELSGFRYRINDVFMNLGNHKVQLFQKLDFKKKMIKSPDLKEYFQEHPNEKQLLMKEINSLRKKLNHQSVEISEHIPAYLVPQCLKSSYDEKMKQVQKQYKNSQAPQYVEKARRALKHVDLEEQDPQHTDISRLKLISSRKRWKLQHGFKLKKRNRRNEKKGIFESS